MSAEPELSTVDSVHGACQSSSDRLLVPLTPHHPGTKRSSSDAELNDDQQRKAPKTVRSSSSGDWLVTLAWLIPVTAESASNPIVE